MIKWIVTHKGAFNRSATFSLSFPTTSDDVDRQKEAGSPTNRWDLAAM